MDFSRQLNFYSESPQVNGFPGSVNYFYPPTVPVSLPQAHAAQPVDLTRSQQQSMEYSYVIRIINPKNKREFMDLTWHNENRRFESVVELKSGIVDAFSEYVPSSQDIQIGYFEGRGSQKRWIVRSEDLGKMYDCYFVGSEVKLWCEGKSKEVTSQALGQKRQLEDSEIPQSKKRERPEDEERKIRKKLEDQHKEAFTAPQYTLWAKFIRMGRHDSYEEPPAIPLLTGKQRGRTSTRKDGFSEALAGAATAFAQAMTPSKPSSSSSSLSLSPNNKANLRKRYLEDLRSISSLLNDGVLTSEEFQEQKDNLLAGLRGLK